MQADNIIKPNEAQYGAKSQQWLMERVRLCPC